MRLLPTALMLPLAVASCSSKKSDDAAKKSPDKTAPDPLATRPKKPVDTAPLPGLGADPGGASGKPIWQTGLGGLGTDSARDLAIGAGGEVYVAGYFDGEASFGPAGKLVAPAKKSNGYLAKLGADGVPVWARGFGADRDDVANGVATRGDTVIVVGNFLDEIKHGEFGHKAAGSDDLFVAALDKDGKELWLWTAGSIDSDGANAVASTPDGGWVIGGSFSATATFGPTKLTSRGGADAMLIKLAPSGDLEWIKQFGGRYNDAIVKLAVDAQGSIFVQGLFRDKAKWGGDELVAAGGADNDVVLAKYDLNGDHLWSKRFGNAFDDVAGGVTVDPSGAVTMVGAFDKSVSFGPGDDHNSLGESDIFIARFTGAGKLEWARTFGAERADIAYGVAADAAGNTVTTGWYERMVDFGKGNILTAKNNNKDVFAVKLDAKGETVWARSWGDKDHDQGRAVAMDDKGNAVVAGIFRFTLALAGTPVESVHAEGDRIPPPDTFVVKLER